MYDVYCKEIEVPVWHSSLTKKDSADIERVHDHPAGAVHHLPDGLLNLLYQNPGREACKSMSNICKEKYKK